MGNCQESLIVLCFCMLDVFTFSIHELKMSKTDPITGLATEMCSSGRGTESVTFGHFMLNSEHPTQQKLFFPPVLCFSTLKSSSGSVIRLP